MRSRILARTALPALLALAGAALVSPASAQKLATRTVPEDTVVRVKLDRRLTSREAKVGDRFTATVVSDDRSGFPQGTRLEGRVTEVETSSKDKPGVLDMSFDRAILPGGATVNVDGRLASLSDDDVRRNSDGRIETRKRSSGNGKFDAKWVGYGAAGGAVLSTILGGGFLKGALLGGVGGAVYSYLNRGKGGGRDRYHDVELSEGQEFGVRMTQRVAFDDRRDYRYPARLDDRDRDRIDDRDRADRADRRDDAGERVLGSREELRFDSTEVRVDGRPVSFTDARPMNVNGQLFVPLMPVARAANVRVSHRFGEPEFVIYTKTGEVRGHTGDAELFYPGSRRETLEMAPLSINGDLYVPAEFLSRVTEMDVNWDRRARKLELETAR